MSRHHHRVVQSIAWQGRWVIQRLYYGKVWCDIGEPYPSQWAAMRAMWDLDRGIGYGPEWCGEPTTLDGFRVTS